MFAHFYPQTSYVTLFSEGELEYAGISHRAGVKKGDEILTCNRGSCIHTNSYFLSRNII